MVVWRSMVAALLTIDLNLLNQNWRRCDVNFGQIKWSFWSKWSYNGQLTSRRRRFDVEMMVGATSKFDVKATFHICLWCDRHPTSKIDRQPTSGRRRCANWGAHTTKRKLVWSVVILCLFLFICMGGGNCLYNPVSILLSGREITGLVHLPRVAVSLEKVLHLPHYAKHLYIENKLKDTPELSKKLFCYSFPHSITFDTYNNLELVDEQLCVLKEIWSKEILVVSWIF